MLGDDHVELALRVRDVERRHERLAVPRERHVLLERALVDRDGDVAGGRQVGVGQIDLRGPDGRGGQVEPTRADRGQEEESKALKHDEKKEPEHFWCSGSGKSTRRAR